MTSIPMSVEGISADWLTATLRGAGHAVTVTSCEHRAVIGGNATKVRLHITAVADDGSAIEIPTDLCVKVGMELQDPTKNLTGSTYDVEGRFYLDVAPQLGGLAVPRCLAVLIDPASHRCALVMEDLIAAGGVFGNPLHSLISPAQTEMLLGQLARVHAGWWQGAREMPIANLERGIARDNRLGRYYSTFDETYIAGLLDSSRGSAIPSELHDARLLVDAFWSYADFTLEQPTCVIHADPHLANVYIRADGSCGIADWQTLRWGPWAHDVAYLITSTLSIEDRRSHDTALLGSYLEALGQAGAPAPPSDEALAAYRKSMVYGMFGWLTAPAYFGYPEELSNTYANKFAIAALEHGTLEGMSR